MSTMIHNLVCTSSGSSGDRSGKYALRVSDRTVCLRERH